MLLNILNVKIKITLGNYKDHGEKSDESTPEVSASFTCQDCGKKFNSRQEMKEHTH
jgi:transposase-like protein